AGDFNGIAGRERHSSKASLKFASEAADASAAVASDCDSPRPVLARDLVGQVAYLYFRERFHWHDAGRRANRKIPDVLRVPAARVWEADDNRHDLLPSEDFGDASAFESRCHCRLKVLHLRSELRCLRAVECDDDLGDLGQRLDTDVARPG